MEENTNRLQMTEEFIEKRQKLQRIEAEIKKTVVLADRKRLPVKKANSDIADILAGIDDDFIRLPRLSETQ